MHGDHIARGYLRVGCLHGEVSGWIATEDTDCWHFEPGSYATPTGDCRQRLVRSRFLDMCGSVYRG